jgi:hypothetical protein
MKSFDVQTVELGAVAATRRYDAFGNTLAGGWTSPFAHGGPFGYQTEANGLQLLGHRWYEPSLGRFLSKDSAEDGRNWHTYRWNNPVIRADPSGHAFLVIAVGAAFVVYKVIETVVELWTDATIARTHAGDAEADEENGRKSPLRAITDVSASKLE